MAEYNGWESWTAWNVNLWLTNDECTYKWLVDLKAKYGIARATNTAFEDLQGGRTPDGAKYTRRSIRACLQYM